MLMQTSLSAEVPSARSSFKGLGAASIKAASLTASGVHRAWGGGGERSAPPGGEPTRSERRGLRLAVRAAREPRPVGVRFRSRLARAKRLRSAS